MADDATQIQPDPQVAMRDVVRFMRQLSHDLRNHLNAAELQAAYVNEIAEDAELKEELKRLRAMMSEIGAALQKVTATLGDIKVTPMEYPAKDFIDDMRRKIEMEFAEAKLDVAWQVDVEGAMLDIDPQLVQQALLELFDNAIRHHRGGGTIKANATATKGELVLTIEEPKSGFDKTTDLWGHEPLSAVSHGHYGLGLYRVRRILDAHRGHLQARYDRDAASLFTEIRLPLAGGAR